MRKRLLLIGLLVVGVALLSGCAVLDYIIDAFGRGGMTSSVYPISGRMGFNLAATVWRDDGYTGPSSSTGKVGTTFWSGAGEYDEDQRCFNAYIWDGGDFNLTAFIVYLSEDEKTITHFVGNQTQANVWGGYTYYHYIRGVNVPFSHVDGNSRFYVAEGTAVRAFVTELEFKMWVPGTERRGSYETPLEWITGGPAALTGSADDVISIRLDYQNPAVAPGS